MERRIYVAVTLMFFMGAFLMWSKISAPESGWVCRDGQWIAQGNPSFEKPSASCTSGERAGFEKEGLNTVQEDTRSEEEKIQWERVANFVKECGVKSIVQNHNREVTITLKNTLKQKAIQAKMDDIVEVACEVEEKCGRVEVVTQ